MLYCGRLIGTNPDMFRGILKIRVGWVLEAIRIYLQLFPEEKRAEATIESLSPYKLRTLLQKALTVSDWAEERGYVYLMLLIYRTSSANHFVLLKIKII